MNNNYANQSEIFTLLDGLVSELNRAIDEFKTRNSHVETNERDACNHDAKVDHDAEMLQLDQNLAADIDVVDKHLSDTIIAINDATNKKIILEEQIKDLEAEKCKLSCKLQELNDERERIHKAWVSIHPAQTVATPDSKKMSVASIFRDYFWSEFSDDAEDSMQRLYWRFYSLVSGKTSATRIFGRTITFNDVIGFLEGAHAYDAVKFLKGLKH